MAYGNGNALWVMRSISIGQNGQGLVVDLEAYQTVVKFARF